MRTTGHDGPKMVPLFAYMQIKERTVEIISTSATCKAPVKENSQSFGSVMLPVGINNTFSPIKN